MSKGASLRGPLLALFHEGINVVAAEKVAQF
jgi:hypothetical protein